MLNKDDGRRDHPESTVRKPQSPYKHSVSNSQERRKNHDTQIDPSRTGSGTGSAGGGA
jgi:hypothetical protein